METSPSLGGSSSKRIRYYGLQLDPLQIIARSQDITLHSRVLDYTPGMWEEVTYQQRKFFDWGGWLAVRPMDELPHWRVVMRRERDDASGTDSRIHQMGIDHAEAIAEILGILRERGTVTNRDFKMASRTRTHSYRGRKDSALALYYLWRTGEVMTHHRENFERVYALTETVAPAHLIYESNDDEVDRFLFKKDISSYPRGGGVCIVYSQTFVQSSKRGSVLRDVSATPTRRRRTGRRTFLFVQVVTLWTRPVTTLPAVSERRTSAARACCSASSSARRETTNLRPPSAYSMTRNV